MNIIEFASKMWPMWVLGAGMIWATIKTGHKDLVRIQKSSIYKWIAFMLSVTILRFALFEIYRSLGGPMGPIHNAGLAAADIPLLATFTVFWEDACHGLPLVLLQRAIGTKWYTWPIHAAALLLVMISFGLGHTYQGNTAALMISLYVPVSMRLGKKHGFGTVMACHSIYDLFTILMVKWMSAGGM